MNEELNELLTPDILLSYTKACIKVTEVLIDLRFENYKRLIIPSRGAYPFYDGALTAFHQLFKSRKELSGLMSWFNLWLLPFTSEWGGKELPIASKHIRKFWAKIVADTIRKESTPFSNYYNSLVNLVGSRLTVNTTDLTLEKYYKKDNSEDKKFVFIDTAISGRAICEVIEGFLDCNLNSFHIIMIADENGQAIQQEFRVIIEREKALGRLTQINVQKIFSEDTSPLLNSGITSIVFPSLMETAFHEIKEFNQAGITGAGIWFIDSTSHLRDKNPIINGIQGALHTMIFMGIQQNYKNDNNWFDEMVQFNVETMIKRAATIDIFNPETTRELVFDRILHQKGKEVGFADVTKSHVMRITLEQSLIQYLIKQANRF